MRHHQRGIRHGCGRCECSRHRSDAGAVSGSYLGSTPDCTSSVTRCAESLCCEFVQDAHAKSTEAMKGRMQGLASSLGLPPQ